MKAYIAVGSNMGDRATLIKQAEDSVQKISGIHLKKKSAFYETEPVGAPGPQEKYLNGVWEIETSLQADKLLAELMKVETSLGRVRKEKNEPRPIDLDILFYGGHVIKEEGLSVPHPRLHERWFVLKPLADLCPDFIHPEKKETVRVLLSKVVG